MEAAPDYETYLVLLDRVPAHWRDEVIRHCQTSAALAQVAAERRAERSRRRRRIGLEP